MEKKIRLWRTDGIYIKEYKTTKQSPIINLCFNDNSYYFGCSSTYSNECFVEFVCIADEVKISKEEINNNISKYENEKEIKPLITKKYELTKHLHTFKSTNQIIFGFSSSQDIIVLNPFNKEVSEFFISQKSIQPKIFKIKYT